MATMQPNQEIVSAGDQTKDKAKQLTIRVKDQGGEETFFKVKCTTLMSKIFAAYAQRKGVQKSVLRFLLDGERINPEETADTLELEDHDQIDVLLEQYGGSV